MELRPHSLEATRSSDALSTEVWLVDGRGRLRPAWEYVHHRCAEGAAGMHVSPCPLCGCHGSPGNPNSGP
eukprot:43835-Chlamydomonas_euryale.AAC.7